jgi:hypothetical protein
MTVASNLTATLVLAGFAGDTGTPDLAFRLHREGVAL